jgi:hypothetical protein
VEWFRSHADTASAFNLFDPPNGDSPVEMVIMVVCECASSTRLRIKTGRRLQDSVVFPFFNLDEFHEALAVVILAFNGEKNALGLFVNGVSFFFADVNSRDFHLCPVLQRHQEFAAK